jgi:hypothetical protein
MKHAVNLLFELFFYQVLIALSNNSKNWWHGQERTIRYHPEGNDFVITNGNWFDYFDKYRDHLYGAVQSSDLKS